MYSLKLCYKNLFSITNHRYFHYLSSRSSKITTNGIYKLLSQQHEDTFQLDGYAKLPYLELWKVIHSKAERHFPIEFQSPQKIFLPGDNIDADHQQIIQRLYKNEKPRSILLYVHGFHDSPNTIWTNANYLQHTLLYSLNNNRNCLLENTSLIDDIIVYDWPTTYSNRYVEKLDPFLAYAHDVEMAMASVRRLNRLLYILLDSGITIHFLGHNMGAHIVINSLQSLTHDYSVVSRDQTYDRIKKETQRIYQERLNHIGHIILKQPDLDVTNMVAFVNKGMRRINSSKSNERKSLLNIFVHDSDHRLELSEYIHNRKPRVGQCNGQKLLIEKLQKNSIENLGIQFLDMSKIIDQGKSWNKLSCCDETFNLNPSFESIVTDTDQPVGNHTYFHDMNFQAYLQQILESRKSSSNEDPLGVAI